MQTVSVSAEMPTRCLGEHQNQNQMLGIFTCFPMTRVVHPIPVATKNINFIDKPFSSKFLFDWIYWHLFSREKKMFVSDTDRRCSSVDRSAFALNNTKICFTLTDIIFTLTARASNKCRLNAILLTVSAAAYRPPRSRCA